MQGAVIASGVSATGRTAGIGPAGMSAQYADVANTGDAFGAVQPFSSQIEWSALAVGSIVSSSAVKTFVSQRYGASQYNQISLWANLDNTMASVPGTISLFVRPTSILNCGCSAAAQFDGLPHAWVLRTAVAGGAGIWRDGIRQLLTGVSATPAPATYCTTTQKTVVGNLGDYTGTGYACVDPIYLVVAWPRALPDALAAYLSASPWSVFATPAQPWPSPSAASALYPTLTAAGMSGITSTGGRPQVTYTF